MNRDEFFAGVCAGLGWTPTPWRLAVFDEWARHEGMPFEQTWNPIATTRVSPAAVRNPNYDIGYGVGNWNSVHVGVYRDAAAGIAATVETLALDYYPNVRRCMAEQAGYPEAVPELATYVGSVAYGQALVQFMTSCTADKGGDVADPRVDDILRALTGREGTDATARLAAWNTKEGGKASGWSLLDGYLEQQGHIAQLATLLQTLPGVSPDVLAALVALGEAAKKAQGGKV
jgi:hypothetical protein